MVITVDEDRSAPTPSFEFMAGALQSQDARAGIDSFVNKKPKPKWTGR